MAVDPFTSQLRQNITSLISERKFKEAYNLCKDYITKYPDYAEDIKPFFLQIEEMVESKNKEYVENKLDEIEKLYDSKDYTLIIKELRELQKFLPNNEKIKEELIKAQSLYRKKIEVSQEEYKKSLNLELSKLLKEKKYDQLLEKLFNLEKNNIGNKLILNITKYFRDKVIESKISDHRDLIYSEKFSDTEHLISELEKIDKNSKRISDLKSISKLMHLDDISNQKLEFLYSGKKHLDVLIQIKKYDKALMVVDEILNVSPKDKFALKMKKYLEKKLFGENREIAISKILEKPAVIGEEFIRI